MAAAAATEASRSSSSGSADSYIGSLISLTSKSEIRYEGILFNINTEESSIGLRNVRSFGTEGRRRDGPQVPPSDKVYEYILFRGTDIKDLQVKSSPPIQSTTSLHNDPAIIQSHYPPATIPATSLPHAAASAPDLPTNTSQLGLPRPTLQGTPPLFQPGANLASWGSSPLPTSNSGGLAMPMYWQGLYGGPSNGPQAQHVGQHVPQQQPLLQPPPGLSMLPSMQQAMQYPPMNISLPNVPAENRPPLLPPFTGSINLMSPMLSSQSSAIASDPSKNLISEKSSTQNLPAGAPSNNSLPLLPPLTAGLDNISTSVAPSVSEAKSNSILGTSNSILDDGKMPALVTPDQLLQPGLPAVSSSSQSSQTIQKDVEVVQLASSELATQPVPVTSATDVQEPILPLPPPATRKLHGAPGYNPHYHRGGRGRGRGSELSRSATRFTEDFDFTAMNEKFNKDEVWGHLGKSNKSQEDRDDSHDEDNAGSSKNDKPVYVKDDFFDSLSCDALDGGSRNGRPRFSEQVRRDTETFGNFRYHGGRGGRGPYRGGGRGRGSYHGRGYGYGYGTRGRGYGMSGRTP